MVTQKQMSMHISRLIEQRRKKAEIILKKLVDVLINKYSVNKIILLGSLSDKYRFGFHSDIDLGVEGISNETYFSAVGDLLLEAEDFTVDILPLENSHFINNKKIKKGKIIYEKK